MRKYWSQTDGRGRPLAAGQLAYVIDKEDGSRPIYVYGATAEEILEKVATTAGTAQLTLDQLRANPAPQNGNGRSTPPAPAPVRRPPMTADQQMQTVEALKHPGKAPAAIVDLIQSETGLDMRQLAAAQFRRAALAWQKQNPDFVHHPANVRLLTEYAIRAAGGLGKATEEHLDQAYAQLLAEGILVGNDEWQQPEPPNPNPSQAQDGTPNLGNGRQPAPRTATTYRRSSLSAPPSPSSVAPRLAYTRDQIERMSVAEMDRVMHTPEYTKAYDYYNSHPVA